MASELTYTISSVNGSSIAKLGINLNAADQQALQRVGSPSVEFGGTIDYTFSGSKTVALQTNPRQIVDGLVVSYTFKSGTSPAENQAMAQGWVTAMTTSLGDALTAARAADAAITDPLSGINSI